MPELRYTIVIYPDGDAYSVLVPALPGCVTFGRSPAEATDMAREAIELWIEHLQDRGEDVPEDVVSGPIASETVTVRVAAPSR